MQQTNIKIYIQLISPDHLRQYHNWSEIGPFMFIVRAEVLGVDQNKHILSS